VNAKAQSVSGPEHAAVMQENIPGAGWPGLFALSFHAIMLPAIVGIWRLNYRFL
jgi:hypothetical protein